MYNVITPWPPQRNGIADYTYALAQYSSRPLTVITQALRPLPCGEMVQVLRDTELESERRLAKGPNLFHIGNNPDHLFAVPQFLRHPGIAVIHDVNGALPRRARR